LKKESIMRSKCTGAERSGAVLPLVAVCFVIVFGFVALAIDLGIMAVARNQAQNAADSAATAGARAFNGDSSNSYNYSAVPNAAFTAASTNRILNNAISAPTLSSSSISTAVSTYTSGQVTVDLGSYAYYYSDDSPAPTQEGFKLDIPRQRDTDPWSAVRATVTANNKPFFGGLFGLSSFDSTAVATAVHRPRDVVIVLDLSGSMRFQSLPGTPSTTTDVFGNSGTFAYPNSISSPRTISLNPESVYPQFGHYSDTSGAALRGSTTYQARSGENVDLGNITTTQNGNSPICADFYSYASGGTASSANVAFSRAADSLATTPGGDDYLKTTRDTTTTPAQTTAQFNNSSTNTYPEFEVSGYQAVRSSFNGYTQGPGYWGKTFWIWPPCPQPLSTALPTLPASIATAFDWSYSGYTVADWRQRFFVGVKTVGNTPAWIHHNTILFDASYATSGAVMNTPGTVVAVTENNLAVSYTYRINYAAILNWIKNTGPNPFPSTLVAGRIRYYSAIPTPTDTTLNNRFWAFDPTSPSGLSNDERFWKEYIDFVLGFYATGANTYNRFQFGTPISSLIGNGDYYTWSGSTVQITQRPDRTGYVASGPYRTGTVNTSAAYNAGATSITLTAALGSIPLANKDYVIFNVAGTDTSPYLITAATTTTLTISPGLATAIARGAAATAKIYSPKMDYSDCPKRPKHQFWFGPMSLVDWLGNYNLLTLVNNTAPHHWWPGNVHEAHSWACKIGIQTAIDDIKQNHPNDFVAMSFFSGPKYSAAGAGHHNLAVVPMGRSYQQLKDSLWFPPSTVTGTNSEISPYDPDMLQVPPRTVVPVPAWVS